MKERDARIYVNEEIKTVFQKFAKKKGFSLIGATNNALAEYMLNNGMARSRQGDVTYWYEVETKGEANGT